MNSIEKQQLVVLKKKLKICVYYNEKKLEIYNQRLFKYIEIRIVFIGFVCQFKFICIFDEYFVYINKFQYDKIYFDI